MKVSLIQNLWLSSLVFLFIGCATNRYKKLSQIETKTIDSATLPSLFKNANPVPLYKTEVSLYGKTFGGLLLIKNMQDSSYRIVFTNETGIKFFDFELKGEKFTVQYCIEKFNRDAVLTTIANDMKLLLLENRIGQNATLLNDSEGKWNIYKFNINKTDDYYFLEKSSNHLQRVEQTQGKKKKVVLTLSAYKNTVPEEIKISHKNIRLTIGLKLLER